MQPYVKVILFYWKLLNYVTCEVLARTFWQLKKIIFKSSGRVKILKQISQTRVELLGFQNNEELLFDDIAFF